MYSKSIARALPEIPVEIYEKIFCHFQPNEEISPADYKTVMLTMSLVCRLFRSICLPLAYECLIFSGKTAQTDDCPKDITDISRGNSGVAFCTSLDSGDERASALAGRIKKCALQDWQTRPNEPELGQPFAGFLQAITAALAKMPHLESLTLESVPISRALLSGIARLTGLTSLSVTRSSTQDDVEPEDIHAVRSLMLTSFGTDHSDLVHMIDPLSQTLREYRSGVQVHDVNGFSCRPTMPLTVLTLDATVFDTQLIFHFLEETPSITHLTATGLVVPPRTAIPAEQLHLSDSSLPNLQHLKVPFAVAHHFAGRPLTSMSISGKVSVLRDEGWIQPNALNRPPGDGKPPFSSLSLLKLEVAENMFLVPLIVEYYPNLTQFSMRGLFVNGDSASDRVFQRRLSRLCTAWPERTPIRELEFHSDTNETLFTDFTWDLKAQRQVIDSQLIGAFPSLRRVAFSEFVVWEGQAAVIPWRAFVPHVHRETVVRHLIRFDKTPWTDHNGCLNSILP